MRFRFASLLLILMWLCVPTAIGFLIYGFYVDEISYLLFAGVAVGICFVLMAFVFILSGRLRCPLCMVPPLMNKRCAKHRNAKRFLGSHRLEVALSILKNDNFNCPYCGEPTAMVARRKK